MTEPTAEQVEAERERAIRALGWEGEDCTIAGVRGIVHDIATALARVRIEAHAAGRDDGLERTEKLARDRRDDFKREFDLGRCSPTALVALSVRGHEAERIADAIRALRGRT